MTIRQPVLSDWILEAMARKLPDKGGKTSRRKEYSEEGSENCRESSGTH